MYLEDDTMRTNKYSSYRGRSPWRSFFKGLAVFVIVLAVLAGAAAVYVQQYLVVSADGVHLELPFLRQDEDPVGTPSSVISDQPVLVIDPSPEPEPEPEPTPSAPVPLPRQALYDGTASAQIEAAGGDCALFDMKADSGALNYVSSTAPAQGAGLSASDEILNYSIRSLNETEGLYTIARISCFKDHGITNYDRSLSIFTNSGYRWTDPDDIRWISPTNPDVRDYLTAVCVELAGLGFDEILLDNAGYPIEGNLHYIKKGDAYNSDQFADVIDGFYAQVAAALSEYDVVLSVVTTQQALDGTDALSGQTPENLARFDRLWTADGAGGFAPVPADSAVS